MDSRKCLSVIFRRNFFLEQAMSSVIAIIQFKFRINCKPSGFFNKEMDIGAMSSEGIQSSDHPGMCFFPPCIPWTVAVGTAGDCNTVEQKETNAELGEGGATDPTGWLAVGL